MSILYIDRVTFGDLRETPRREEGRIYTVEPTLVALFNAWRFNREPKQFLAGLIADAMEESECGTKDDLWHGLVSWMQNWHTTGLSLITPAGWHYSGHNPLTNGRTGKSH